MMFCHSDSAIAVKKRGLQVAGARRLARRPHRKQKKYLGGGRVLDAQQRVRQLGQLVRMQIPPATATSFGRRVHT